MRAVTWPNAVGAGSVPDPERAAMTAATTGPAATTAEPASPTTLDSDGDLGAKAKGKAAIEGTSGAQLKGLQVAVEAETTAEVKGTAQLTLKGGMVMIN